MTLAILNMGRLPRGMVAPGSVFAAADPDVAALYYTGAIFADTATLGSALDDATAMRLRGVDWQTIETYLVALAGNDVTRLVARSSAITCRKMLPPPAPPVLTPCRTIETWAGHGYLDDNSGLILMRGLRQGTRLHWAGSRIFDPANKRVLADAGCEFVVPAAIPFHPSPQTAIDFADWSTTQRKRGALTWEDNEQAAARARLMHAAGACSAKLPFPPCPLHYVPDDLNCGCMPYSIGPAS